jgi:hypothetical protein
MQRNRENAHLSRQRKKQQMNELQAQCTQLRSQNTQLTCLVHRMVAENCLLRHHLGGACKQANIPVPEVPSAMRAAQAAPAAGAPPARPPLPGGAAPARPPPAALPQLNGRPAVAGAPMIAPQQPLRAGSSSALAALTVPPMVPAAAPAAAAAAAAAAGGMHTRKRARTTTTATGAAFLALFSIFLIAAPFSPAPLPAAPLAAATAAGGAGLPALPGHAGAPALRAGGRALLALSPDPSGGGLAAAAAGGAPSPGLATEMNRTLEALLQDPASQRLPAHALQSLRELGPAAVLLDHDAGAAGAGAAASPGAPAAAADPNPLAASNAFPLLAGALFQGAGLAAPQTCQKVFEFAASSLPHPARSRRSVERYVMGAHGFRGRSLTLPAAEGGEAPVVVRRPAAAAAKEPLRIEDPVADADAAAAAQPAEPGPADALLPAAVEEPLLVSVLLPSNASQGGGGSGEGQLTAVDRVFVVLLHPQERYVTYSCGLSRPLLV